jgi:hypothetical protein
MFPKPWQRGLKTDQPEYLIIEQKEKTIKSHVKLAGQVAGLSAGEKGQ